MISRGVPGPYLAIHLVSLASSYCNSQRLHPQATSGKCELLGSSSDTFSSRSTLPHLLPSSLLVTTRTRGMNTRWRLEASGNRAVGRPVISSESIRSGTLSLLQCQSCELAAFDAHTHYGNMSSNEWQPRDAFQVASLCLSTTSATLIRLTGGHSPVPFVRGCL